MSSNYLTCVLDSWVCNGLKEVFLSGNGKRRGGGFCWEALSLTAQRGHSCSLLLFAVKVANMIWMIRGHSFCPFSVLFDTIENVDYEGL